jgi:hypothetical protein
MRFRLLAAFLGVCLAAAGQTALTVDQLVRFIKSSIQLKQPDRQVASYLSRCKMTESLDDRTIEELQGYGAGPRTVEAMTRLRDASQAMPKPAPKVPEAKPQPIPPPSAEEQAKVLEEVRENALNYVKSLPDFICTQVTRRYADPSGLEQWQSMDTLTVRLSYFEQKEDYKLILVNNRVTDQSYNSLGGSTSTGEFGTMLRELFEPRTQARFDWSRWATLRGRRNYVFAYRVALPHSQYHIVYERKMDIIAGYHGEVFVDRDTHLVTRLTSEAEDIPPSFPVQQTRTVLDYDFTKIGERDFLLPLHAEVRMRSDRLLTRNDVEFRMYRKFSAEAQVKFDSETPDALPESPKRFADGARFATSSSATIITERPFSFFGSGRQVCVGCGNAWLFTPEATSFGFDRSPMSRMKMPWCQ